MQLLRAGSTLWCKLQLGDVLQAMSVAEVLKIDELAQIGTTAGLKGWSVVGPHLSEEELIMLRLRMRLRQGRLLLQLQGSLQRGNQLQEL